MMTVLSGPHRSQVTDPRGRRVRPTCDVCNRRLDTNEPWWLVASADRDWINGAGVACSRHVGAIR